MEHASVDKSADLDLQPNEAQIVLPVYPKTVVAAQPWTKLVPGSQLKEKED